MKTRSFSALLIVVIALTSCKKESATPDTEPASFSTAAILTDFSGHIAQDEYNDLATKTASLVQLVNEFNTTQGDAELIACKQGWRDARKAWEQSESFLFGPVATENIDPRIDTWPVNFNSLDSVLATSEVLDAAYVDALEDALKGFHPIEYLLFGQNGAKTAAAFTAREREYLTALVDNLASLTAAMAQGWDPDNAGNYHTIFTTAGAGSALYTTQRAAFEELVNAMAGICDEVANGKMSEPLLMQDPSLEESPFSKNSITDFTNNMRGVQNVYLGRYVADGSGLEDLVRKYDLSLDSQLKQRMASAIAALENITVPFGQAIIDQPVQVQLAIDAINTLATTIEDGLLPLVQQHVN